RPAPLGVGAGQGLVRRRHAPRRRRRLDALVRGADELRPARDERVGGGPEDSLRADGVPERARLPQRGRLAREGGACDAHALDEPVFVPRTPDAPEGDGYVIALVYRAARNASELLILHAQDVAGEPAAVLKVPRRVPAGFHGSFVPAFTGSH